MKLPSCYRTLSCVLLLGLLCLSVACKSGDTSTCQRGISLQPGSSQLYAEMAHAFTAVVETCGTQKDYEISWFYDLDGNGILNDAEKKATAYGTQWQLFSCGSDVGTHLLRVEAAAGDDKPLSTEVQISIVINPERSSRPACYDDAIVAVATAGTIGSEEDTQPLRQAADCLTPYLQTNLCDFQATLAAGLAEFATFAGRIPDRFAHRNQLSVADVEKISSEEVEPILNRYELLAERAPEDFSFLVEGKFEITVFPDLPYLNGSEEVRFLLQGEHDMGDIRAIASFASFLRGGLEILLAYDGFARWFLDTPSLDQVDFAWLRSNIVEHLEADNNFMTLLPAGAKMGGRERLLRARAAFMNMIRRMEDALATVAAETDDQSDDLLRYWDCGSDSVCSCDPALGNNVLACPNQPEDYTGPDDDGTEGNGRYDKGEPVGTDRFSLTDYFTLHLPSDIAAFNRQIEILRKNLQGPDALDLDEIALVPVSWALEAFAIPNPEIRLSEWFLRPGNPRDMVPLYSRSRKDFIFASEGELYQDVGYDGLPDEDEVSEAGNPLQLPVGTPWNRLTNPDPVFDNLDPICNPLCTFTDGIDNDGDGLIDQDDRAVIDRFGYTVYLPQELGVEENLMFDFVDLNANWLHDKGETSEPFSDTGVRNRKDEVIGKGNGKWDFADSSHVFPNGADIGPNGSIVQTDPANGIAEDVAVRLNFAGGGARAAWSRYEGLFDPFYFYFPEPTFSDTLTFPDSIVNIEGNELSKNAKLLRFFNKILEIAGMVEIAKRTGDGISIPPVNLGAHQCSNPAKCR